MEKHWDPTITRMGPLHGSWSRYDKIGHDNAFNPLALQNHTSYCSEDHQQSAHDNSFFYTARNRTNSYCFFQHNIKIVIPSLCVSVVYNHIIIFNGLDQSLNCHSCLHMGHNCCACWAASHFSIQCI